MPGVEIVKVRACDDGMRLNRWFLKYYPALPLSRFQKLLRTKQIKVDGARAEAGLKLAAGQEVRVPPLNDDPSRPPLERGGGTHPARLRPSGSVAAPLQRRGIEGEGNYMRSLVIYKDEEIIAINKPSGLAAQGGSGEGNRHVDGMLEALRFDYDEKPKLAHRIDKETSGVLLLGRTRAGAEKLAKAFKEHRVRKTYLALVYGVPKKESGVIEARLAKRSHSMAVDEDGDEAVTEYRVLDSIGSVASLIEAKPLTGRTHQIRVHLQYLGTPIVGDKKYFSKEQKRFEKVKDKLYLHSYETVVEGKPLIRAALPDYFTEALETLGLEIAG